MWWWNENCNVEVKKEKEEVWDKQKERKEGIEEEGDETRATRTGREEEEGRSAI